MNETIFTGSYSNCTHGNLISISFDKGKNAGFKGKSMSQLAPNYDFFKIWKNNIGKISEEKNTKYYINEYYTQVLSKIDIEALLKDEQFPILLCYENSNEFCHRHVLAEFINIKYGIYVYEIEQLDDLFYKVHERPKNIRQTLEEVMQKNSVLV